MIRGELRGIPSGLPTEEINHPIVRPRPARARTTPPRDPRRSAGCARPIPRWRFRESRTHSLARPPTNAGSTPVRARASDTTPRHRSPPAPARRPRRAGSSRAARRRVRVMGQPAEILAGATPRLSQAASAERAEKHAGENEVADDVVLSLNRRESAVRRHPHEIGRADGVGEQRHAHRSRQHRHPPQEGEAMQFAEQEPEHDRSLQGSHPAAGLVHAHHAGADANQIAFGQRRHAEKRDHIDRHVRNAAHQLLNHKILHPAGPRHGHKEKGDRKQKMPQPRHAAHPPDSEQRETCHEQSMHPAERSPVRVRDFNQAQERQGEERGQHARDEQHRAGPTHLRRAGGRAIRPTQGKEPGGEQRHEPAVAVLLAQRPFGAQKPAQCTPQNRHAENHRPLAGAHLRRIDSRGGRRHGVRRLRAGLSHDAARKMSIPASTSSR